MTRKHINRRRVLGGAGAGIAAAMAGCLPGGGDGGDGDGGDGGDGNGGDGGTPTPTPNPADLPEVHFITDYYNSAWEARWGELESSFEEQTGIGMLIEEAGMSGQQESRLAQLIQAGEPPDANTSTFDQVANLWSNDQLVPVTDVVDNIKAVAGELLTSPFIPESGDIYQVPHGMYVSNFHYRTDVYEQLGLDAPETMEDILDNARAIDESDMDIRGYGLAGKKTGKSQDEFQTYLQNMGVSGVGLRWKDPDAMEELEIHWPEEEITYLLQWFKDISEYSPDPTSIGWAESIGRWIQGQYAQQYHLNIWPQGLAAQTAEANDSDALRGLARASKVQPIPRWSQVDAEDNWQWEPAPDGYHIMKNGTNTPGIKKWFNWLYADSLERTAGMYAQEPSRFLPTYADVLESDAFQNIGLWQKYPYLLEEMQYNSNVILGEHYGNVPESDLNSPVALYCTRQWFYGEMINQVVTESMTVQEAYDWGREQLEGHVEDARSKFG